MKVKPINMLLNIIIKIKMNEANHRKHQYGSKLRETIYLKNGTLRKNVNFGNGEGYHIYANSW